MSKTWELRQSELPIFLWSSKQTEYISQLTRLSSTEKERSSFIQPTPSKTLKSTSNIHTFSVYLPLINLDESLIPIGILNYVLNPFDLAWYWCSFSLYAAPALVIPRIWYFADFKYYPRKVFLLKGGKVLKVEAQSVGKNSHNFR